jgi:predicted metalloprotease with PDZ domain
MTWTWLDYQPEAPLKLDLAKKSTTVAEMDKLGQFMKGYAKLMGLKPPPPPTPRGFLGIELAKVGTHLTVKKVLEQGPASESGLKTGDRILAFNGKDVATVKDLLHQAAQVTAGQEIQLTVQRGDEKFLIKITAAEGL